MPLSSEDKALIKRMHMSRLIGPEFVTISDAVLSDLLEAARQEERAKLAAPLPEGDRASSSSLPAPACEQAATAALSPAGWRDIGTEPKDGTEFIVYRDDAGVFAAMWLFPPHEDGGIDDSEEPTLFSSGGYDLTREPPTHWMPLPPPPAKNDASVAVAQQRDAGKETRDEPSSPPPEGEMRERIAREIDPELDHHIANATWAKCRALTAAAYEKADAILALFAEERAKAQGEVWDQALALSEMNREAIGYLNRAEAAEAEAERCFQALEGRDQKIIRLEERIVALTCDLQAAEAVLSKSQASLEEAVRVIEAIDRMKLFPGDAINRTTLLAATHLARSFLLKHGADRG